MSFGSISGRDIIDRGISGQMGVWRALQSVESLWRGGEGGCAHMCTFRMDPYTAVHLYTAERRDALEKTSPEDGEFSRERDFEP